MLYKNKSHRDIVAAVPCFPTKWDILVKHGFCAYTDVREMIHPWQLGSGLLATGYGLGTKRESY